MVGQEGGPEWQKGQGTWPSQEENRKQNLGRIGPAWSSLCCLFVCLFVLCWISLFDHLAIEDEVVSNQV